MTALTKPVGWISPEEYLEGELKSEVRHEYVDGCVYAMAGASKDHNLIAGDLYMQICQQIKDGPCLTFNHDVKVKMPSAFGDVFYYPDVVVACDPTDNAKYYVERPSVLIEVISPDTERTDRHEKAIAYRQIPTMQHYVLVEQERMAITILHRAEPGWRPEVIEGPNAVLKLPAIGVEIPLARIYERTTIATRQ